ncbi:precorrin-8X methylmutase [Clostridium sp. BJN0001]|uniref:precorrin-8X methylmutase n=1 Tax=Clostridium sp. BJN0001 TaxID=2930219 RepID=UPI001FD00BCC|nr:precorrin-8X methylmutase [Clostridium sp. BJN0001]
MEYIKNPMEIEKKSFEIIESELGETHFKGEELLILKRVIHTTADFDYKNILEISPSAIETAKELFKKGAKIYTDTHMILSGINKKALSATESSAFCFVRDKDVELNAKKNNITRSMAAIKKASSINAQIYAFGNAPTALFTLKEMINKNEVKPKLIIAAPVGFVGASKSKEDMDKLNIPYIRIKGRKGGSTVTAAIINALMYMVYRRE